MKRRLRKKKRLGEFQELGFGISFTPAAPLSENERAALLWAFIEHAIEANGLNAGGGGLSSMEFFVTSAMRRGSATDAQRDAVQAWLRSRTDVSAFTVGQLVDAWHSPAKV
ncbi:50S ribosome-binding protein YggL [Solimonas sp. SE-A11]|uniref:50S ribosome-binding protein YggL n=1 Tax=Solimonas sp. SE-A11 TaxID=3054954 RepID=UPI00259D303C|nr:50S ribosome-binding protein YggL [Solimonas sp. SE-A11]MDM4770840.1 50S ribosome-binding protein YggL [Solimonas sp. SE-A11]